MKVLLLLVFCHTVSSLYNYCTTTGVSCTSTNTCASGTCVFRDSINKVCCPTANLACRDLTAAATGVSNCASTTAYCTNSLYYPTMLQQCPASCGFCTSTISSISTTCVDQINPSTGVSDCTRLSYLCSNSVYYQTMLVQCPRTCGFCSTSSSVISSSLTTCYDQVNAATGVSDCSSRAYLCTNTYYVTLMRQQCPRTCGYCTVGK